MGYLQRSFLFLRGFLLGLATAFLLNVSKIYLDSPGVATILGIISAFYIIFTCVDATFDFWSFVAKYWDSND